MLTTCQPTKTWMIPSWKRSHRCGKPTICRTFSGKEWAFHIFWYVYPRVPLQESTTGLPNTMGVVPCRHTGISGALRMRRQDAVPGDATLRVPVSQCFLAGSELLACKGAAGAFHGCLWQRGRFLFSGFLATRSDQQTWDLTYRKQWGWVNTHGFPTGWVLKSWCQRTIFFITFVRSKWNDKRPHISFPFRLQLAFRVQPIVVQLGDEKGNGHPVEPLMGSPFPCFSHTENDGKPLGVPRKFFGTLEMKGVGRLVIFWFFGEWWHSGFGVYIYIL